MRKKYKARGVVLLEAFLALMLMSMAAYGMAAVNSVQFSQLAASRDDNQAQNYAELEALYLKQLGYDEVVDDNYDIDDPSRTPRYPEGKNEDVDTASNAREMSKFLGETLGAEWKSTATLGEAVENIGGDQDNKIQNVIVSVYKTTDGAEATPRATVTVPLSTQGSSRVPVGGIIAWPKDSNPSTSSNIWLECNGQSFDTDRFPKLYKVLGSSKVPNYQGMFLRGAGSQSFSQNNGQFTSSSTTYSSGSIGAVQGDGMRRLQGGAGPFLFINPNGISYGIYGNFMKASALGGSYDLGTGSAGNVMWSVDLPYLEYSLDGNPETGYSLSSSVRYLSNFMTYEDQPYGGWGSPARWVGVDSSWATPTANEIRPVNVAVKYYIRAK